MGTCPCGPAAWGTDGCAKPLFDKTWVLPDIERIAAQRE